MKPPKPTGFNASKPPEIHIPDLPVIKEEADEDTFEIKNPILANIFHYGMIAILGIASWATSSNSYDKKKGGF